MAMLVVLIIASLGYVSAQDANCDYSQQVQVGVTYNVYSPNHPNSYPKGVQCRWMAYCPSGYNCRLDCSEINLPQTTSCSMDRLLISKTGDPQLLSADRYCGLGTLSAVSTGQTLSIGLITSSQSTGGRFTCQLYAQRTSTVDNCSCGYKKTNRIVGGVETGVNEFPPMAGVIYGDIERIKCGGTIISQRHVLTAAHCVATQNVNNLAVVVGEHNINAADSPATQGIRVSAKTVHPLYSSSNYDYDIAILTLAQNIQFSERVGPACLPFKFANNDMAGAKLTVLGWGTTAIGAPTSDYLQKVDLDVISQNTCQQAVPNVTPRQICTYTPGKDACQDDSGGPLFYTDPSTGLLFNIGIVSFGRFCASGSPGVNTRVTALLDWIQINTPGTSYCRK